jgi:hypothetical protein
MAAYHKTVKPCLSIADFYPTLFEKVFDVTIAQGQPKVESYGMPDYVRRKQ